MTQANEKRQTDPRFITLSRYLVGFKTGLGNLLGKDSRTSPDRMVQLALAASLKNPKLLDCPIVTISNALIAAAEMQLEPIMGEGYLIPRWNSRANCLECTFQPGYQGLIRLVMQNGAVASLDADVVRKGEPFTYKKGMEIVFTHEPNLTLSANTPVLAAYAIAYMKDSNARTIAVVSGSELDGIRIRADAAAKRSSTSSPWETDFSEMAKKTALKRLCKLLPKRTQDPLWKASSDAEHYDLEARHVPDAMQIAEQAMQEAAQLPAHPQPEPSAKPTRLDRVRAQVAAKVAAPQVGSAQTVQAEFEPDGRIIDTSESQEYDLPEG